jgi:hypothetical protein
MTKLNKEILKGLIFVGLVASAVPASAVSYHGEYYANRFNNIGTTTAVLPPNSNHFCFLSKVNFEEVDGGNEEAECRVRRSGTVWLLEATLGKNQNADAQCRAICYNN